jgi:hypothetical protein
MDESLPAASRNQEVAVSSSRRTGRSSQGAVRAEDVIEAAIEFRVGRGAGPQPSSLLARNDHEAAGLLGDPRTVRVGGHPGQVDPSGLQFDEAQDVQPSQPDGSTMRKSQATIEAAAGAGTPPGRGPSSWRWAQSVTTQCRADRGCRDPDPKGGATRPNARVASARVLRGHMDDQLLYISIDRRPL